MFLQIFDTELQSYSIPILKREKINFQELYNISMEVDIFDHEMALKLSKYLFYKMKYY